MVAMYVNPTTSGSNASPSNNGNSQTVTLDSLRTSLTNLISRGVNETAHLPQLTNIINTLRKQADTNAKALEVLLLIDQVLADLR